MALHTSKLLKLPLNLSGAITTLIDMSKIYENSDKFRNRGLNFFGLNNLHSYFKVNETEGFTSIML